MTRDDARSFAERYADRIELDPTTGCHNWAGGRDRDGYGRLARGGRRSRAHVFAWEDANGRRVPRGRVVAHACDNPSCVNPDHLDAKTQRENIEDRQARDRQAKGSRNGRAKLTEEQVAAAKRVLTDGSLTQARLARLLGIHPTTVRDIERGRIWSHVDPE